MTPEEIEERANLIHPLLAGIGHEGQGAVLVDLVAMWVAGHFVFEGKDTDRDSTTEIRQAVFDAWVKTMWQLVDINEDILRENNGLPPRKESHASQAD